MLRCLGICAGLSSRGWLRFFDPSPPLLNPPCHCHQQGSIRALIQKLIGGSAVQLLMERMFDTSSGVRLHAAGALRYVYGDDLVVVVAFSYIYENKWGID